MNLNGRNTLCSKNLTQNLIIIVATKNKEGTVGTSFHGVKNNILSPDPESGEGEIIVSSRAVFMGYVKVRKKKTWSTRHRKRNITKYVCQISE